MAFVKPFFDLCQSFSSFFSWNAWKHLFRIWTQWDILKPFSKVYKGSYYVLIFFWKKVNFAKDYLDSFVDSVSVHLLYWLSRAPVTSYFRLCIQLLEVKMIIDLFFSCLLSWWLIELLWNTIASNCFSGVFRSLANDELSSRFWHT